MEVEINPNNNNLAPLMRNVPKQLDELIPRKKLFPNSPNTTQRVENLNKKGKHSLYAINRPHQLNGTPHTRITLPCKEEVILHMKLGLHKIYDFHKPQNS